MAAKVVLSFPEQGCSELISQLLDVSRYNWEDLLEDSVFVSDLILSQFILIGKELAVKRPKATLKIGRPIFGETWFVSDTWDGAQVVPKSSLAVQIKLRLLSPSSQ